MNLKSISLRTIRELEKAGCISAELDVHAIFKFVLQKSDDFLLARSEAPLTNSQYQKFRRLIRRRKKSEPVACLVGEKEFYGLKFKVNKNVLIPRPESELVVEETINFLKLHKNIVSFPRRRESTDNRVDSRLRGNDRLDDLSIIDVGTGSGCIIISLANQLGASDLGLRTGFYATDISPTALRIAKRNAKLLHISDQIKFYQSNLLSNPRLPKNLDIIVANLPYIPSGKKYQDINYTTLSYEPKKALFGGPKGYELIKKLMAQISKRTYQPKLIVLEIFEDYAKELKLIAKKCLPKYKFELKKDLAGLNRLVILTNSSPSD